MYHLFVLRNVLRIQSRAAAQVNVGDLRRVVLIGFLFSYCVIREGGERDGSVHCHTS